MPCFKIMTEKYALFKMDNLTLSKIKKSLQVFGDYRAYKIKKTSLLLSGG